MNHLTAVSVTLSHSEWNSISSRPRKLNHKIYTSLAMLYLYVSSQLYLAKINYLKIVQFKKKYSAAYGLYVTILCIYISSENISVAII